MAEILVWGRRGATWDNRVGLYKVQVTFIGFRPFVETDVRVVPAKTTEVEDIELLPGAILFEELTAERLVASRRIYPPGRASKLSPLLHRRLLSNAGVPDPPRRPRPQPLARERSGFSLHPGMDPLSRRRPQSDGRGLPQAVRRPDCAVRSDGSTENEPGRRVCDRFRSQRGQEV